MFAAARLSYRTIGNANLIQYSFVFMFLLKILLESYFFSSASSTKEMMCVLCGHLGLLIMMV